MSCVAWEWKKKGGEDETTATSMSQQESTLKTIRKEMYTKKEGKYVAVCLRTLTLMTCCAGAQSG